jgi:hypothetical protein
MTPTYTRSADHNAVGRALTQETDRIGAPYLQKAIEAKRRMKTTTCPNCKEQHPIEHGTDKDGNQSHLLSFATCPHNDTTYLVEIEGKPIDRERTEFISSIIE